MIASEMKKISVNPDAEELEYSTWDEHLVRIDRESYLIASWEHVL